MHTWAKRGLQTALVTGGLLMLGTGIASADENVDPDRPASPLDGSVSVPVHVANNALGTPVGQKNLPSINRDLSINANDLTNALPKHAKPVTDVTGGVQQVARPVTDKAAALTNKTSGALGGHDVFRGNRVSGDLVVPVDISGNAIAVGGKADVTNDSQQSVDQDRPVVTGSHGPLGGNVVDADWVAPIGVTGNAVSVVGASTTHNSATQEASSTGDVIANGSRGTLSGNLVAPQFATPVQVTGNAITGGGRAEAVNQTDTSATSGGHLTADGSHGILAGNVGGAPLATPVEVNGNPVAGLGRATTMSSTSADATAGGQQVGPHGALNYIHTNGDPAVLSGNIAQPGHAGPVSANCNAAGAVGAADCAGDQTTTSTAGGGNATSGYASIASGTVIDAPTSNPAQVFGNSAAGGGEASAQDDNAVDANSGGSNYTNGSHGIGSGTVAAPAAAGPVDVFANAPAAAGKSTASTSNTANSTAGGGYNGTVGQNSVAGGNAATVPVTLPAEGYGNSAAGVGTSQTSGSEHKTVTAGGTSSTDDDAGLLAANLVNAPVAGAAQGFGNAAGVLGHTDANGDNESVVTAGGLSKAKGVGGMLAGNIAQAPVSLPAQLFGTGATAGGTGQSTATNDSTLTAGGDALTDGTHGFGTGNIVSGTAGSAAQLFGESAAGLGNHHASADGLTNTFAGGNATTAGTGGTVAGNVISPQALPLAQVFGDSAGAIGGHGSSTTGSDTSALSGGDVTTNGDHGFIAGNLLQVPAAAAPQPFGDAAGVVGGVASTTTNGYTNGVVGGDTQTSGEAGKLSGLNGKLPVGAVAQIYNVPLDVLGRAFTQTSNGGDIAVGERNPQLDLPIDGAGIGANQLPRIPLFFSPARSALPGPWMVPGLNAVEGMPFVGELGDLGDHVSSHLGGRLVQPPQLPGVDSLPTATLPVVGTGELPTAAIPAVGDHMPALPKLPAVGQVVPSLPAVRDGAPALPVVGDGVPALPKLPAVGQVVPSLPAVRDGAPALPVVGDGVPALPGAADLPTAPLPVVGHGSLPSADQLPTGALPVIGDGGAALPAVRDGVPSLPAVPALPAVGQHLPGLPTTGDLPIGALPVVGQGKLPGLPTTGDLPIGALPVGDVHAMPLPTPTPAGLPQLPVAAPALPGTDTTSVLPAEASLADTAAKLQALFGQLPSASSLPIG